MPNRLKFQRDYFLKVEKNDPANVGGIVGTTPSGVTGILSGSQVGVAVGNIDTSNERFINVVPPLSVEFDIIRTELSSQNVSTIRVYNLSERRRNQIIKDQWDFGNDKEVKFQAGYKSLKGKELPVCFSGNVTRCFSIREGSNYITQIEAFDAGSVYVNANISRNFKKGTKHETIIQILMDQMKRFGIERGAIGKYTGELTKDRSYNGSLTSLLSEVTGDTFFIDNKKVHALGESEFIKSPGGVFTVTSASGLLSTPKREENILSFDMVFEPRLSIGEEIDLRSITGANYNMKYKVVSVQHRGIISESVPGKAITTVGVYFGKALTPVLQ